jgi:hypothetical protein
MGLYDTQKEENIQAGGGGKGECGSSADEVGGGGR